MKPSQHTLTEVAVEESVKEALLHFVHEEGQVIVHICYHPPHQDLIRVWPSTFLIPKPGGAYSKLIHAENISLYPKWMLLEGGKEHTFTLVFSPLPRDCQRFDLLEQIPEYGGFHIPNIARNKQDVYHLRLEVSG